ncbi:MAG TPA: VOC family protein [Fimbriimonadaceae bacterium]|nr:VOC family protein [Fimbriimonadaceae bacterium]
MAEKAPGEIVWHDLTVDDAASVRDFYSAVVGWESSDHDMGDYEDYVLQTPGGATSVGVCHARGTNANVPHMWLMYVRVESVSESVEQCMAFGGDVVDGPRMVGNSKFCIIRDPAGAFLALIEE